jgi:hypothetical protein
MDIVKFTNYTNTTKFILPLLFDDETKYHVLLQNLFINAYIADMSHQENDDNIHLLFADYPSLTFQKNLTDPISEYRYKDGYVLVYPLNKKWNKDYEKIIRSEYSKISEHAKERILTFWDEDDTSVLYGILYKKKKYLQKYFEEILKVNTSIYWSNTKEWWLNFKITDEILGLQ